MNPYKVNNKPIGFFYRNIANAISIIGVLPLALLFLNDGYIYLIPLIIFNNIMDDLDGILATKLNIRSQFGANLDNVCDAVAHVIILFAVGAHFGGTLMIACTITAGSLILRVVSRLNPENSPGTGSPTNELMRHLLLVILLSQIFSFEPEPFLLVLFLLHSISMIVPYKMSGFLRERAKSITEVGLINIALVFAWLIPASTPLIAAAFFITYLYAFIKMMKDRIQRNTNHK